MTIILPYLIGRRYLFTPISTPSLPNADYGQDVRNWLEQSIDNAAPDGVFYMPTRPPPPSPLAYYGGDLGDIRGSAFLHPYNPAKPRNGWPVYKAWEPGGVAVDLSPTAGSSTLTVPTKGGALNAGSYSSAYGIGSMRVIFDDILFANGAVRFSGTDRVRFWNCRRTYPMSVWKAHFDAACAQMGVPIVSTIPDTPTYQAVRDSVYMKNNYQPSGLRLQTGAGSQYCSNIRTYGEDVMHIGDDGYMLGGAQHGCQFVGARIWDVDSTGVGALADWFHNDSVQFVGGEFDIAVADSWLGQHVQFASQSGSINQIYMDRIWQAGSTETGMSLDATSSYGHPIGPTGNIGGTLDRFGNPTYYRWFANGQNVNHAGYNAGYDVGVVVSGTPSLSRTLDHIAVPSGITVVGGIANIDQIRDHPLNPANLWRAANFDRDTVLAGTWD